MDMTSTNVNNNNISQSGSSNLATIEPATQGLTINLSADFNRDDLASLSGFAFEQRVKGELRVLEGVRKALQASLKDAEAAVNKGIDSFVRSTFPQFYDPLPVGFASFGLERDKVRASSKFSRNEDNTLMIEVTFVLEFKANKTTSTQKANYGSHPCSITYTNTVPASPVLIALINDREGLNTQFAANGDAISSARSNLANVDSVVRAARASLVTSALQKSTEGQSILAELNRVSTLDN